VSTHPGMTGPSGATGPASQKSQRELEFQAGQRAVARHRGASPSVPPGNTNGAANVIPFPGERIDTRITAAVTAKQPQTEGVRRGMLPGEQDAAGTVAGPTGNTGVQGGSGDGRGGGGMAEATGPTGNTGSTGNTGPTRAQPGPNASQAKQSGTSLPKFDHAMALEFYNAVRPSAFIWGFTQGRSITSAKEFQVLAKEADDKHEHLFFPVAVLKPEWGDPKTHAKGKITTPSIDKAVNMPDGSTSHVLECPYLWGDCDAEKYAGNDPVAAAKHYENEGSRVKTAIDKGLLALGITPFDIWRSGAGWQFLIKLDQAIEPYEAEILVGKLHVALGFDPVVRNPNRILRVPGSVNWKNGKDGRVPSPCVPLHLLDAVTKIGDVRNALANVTEPVKEAKPSGAKNISIDWPKVKSTDGWLKSVADLPDDAPPKLRLIIGHGGNLKELNEDLIKLGMLTKGYGSWSDVTHAIAASFKLYGKYTPEQIAEALLADLPCNQHVARAKDKERAVERAINRSHDPKPKPNDPAGGKWPGGCNDETGNPKKGILNTIEAIKRDGIVCTFDQFRQKEYWFGHADKSFDGEVSDAAVTVTRRNICTEFRIYPDAMETRDAITDACHDNKSNPVLDYFGRLKWDSKPRLDKMLHNYLGADDTPLNAAIGLKTMCAIVRRAKQPGCKFDHQLVLQCGQGIRKSMFCEDLAVFPDLFTDAGDLAASIKEQLEVGQGKQIIEFPEHAGHGRAARDRNKASLSRKVDRARMAYAHYATDTPRQWVAIATVNPGGYLNDPTGERRYWHVAVMYYDRDAFLADKDQLYAEAVEREPQEKLWLDTPDLVAAHDAVVATVKEPNELMDLLRDLPSEVWHVNGRDEERVSAQDIRTKLGMTTADAVRSHSIGGRIMEAMMALGWTKAPGTIRCHKKQGPMIGNTPDPSYTQPTTGYTRPLPAALVLTGPTGATGATGAAGAPAKTGPGPAGPAGPVSAAGGTSGTTLDRLLMRGLTKAQADIEFVRGNS
jgi:hypothetical protein